MLASSTACITATLDLTVAYLAIGLVYLLTTPSSILYSPIPLRYWLHSTKVVFGKLIRDESNLVGQSVGESEGLLRVSVQYHSERGDSVPTLAATTAASAVHYCWPALTHPLIDVKQCYALARSCGIPPAVRSYAAG